MVAVVVVVVVVVVEGTVVVLLNASPLVKVRDLTCDGLGARAPLPSKAYEGYSYADTLLIV